MLKKIQTICAILLVSLGFFINPVNAELASYSKSTLQLLSDSQLEAELSSLQTQSATLQTEIESISRGISGSVNPPATLKLNLAEKKQDLDMLYQNKINPIRVELNSRNTVGLAGVLSIEGQGFFTDAASFLGSIIDFLVKFVGFVALALLIFGGIRLVVSGGNDNAVQNSKQMITYAVIGLVVALSAYLIVVFIRGLLYT